MLVAIFTDVLFGGLGYGKLQPQCARMKMASLPKLNLVSELDQTKLNRLLPNFCLCNHLQKKEWERM